MGYLNNDGLIFLWTQIKNFITANKVTKTSELTNDSNFAVDANYVHTDSNYTAAEKTKLAGIATGANKTTVDTALSATSTNPVQNKAVNAALGNKVDKVSGKGLSTNDFTTAYKNTLDGLSDALDAKAPTESPTFTGTVDSSGATKVKVPIDEYETLLAALTGGQIADYYNDAVAVKTFFTYAQGVERNFESVGKQISNVAFDATTAKSTANGVSDKLATKANISSPALTGTPTAPTAAAGTNSTQIATTAFVQTAVAGAVGGVTSITYEIVTALPESGTAGKIYLIAHTHGDKDIYDEYMWFGDKFEKLGNTDVDLSAYLKTADLDETITAITNQEIEAICV